MQTDNTKHLMIAIAALFGLTIVCATVLAIAIPDSSTMITIVAGIVVTGAGFLINHFKQQEVENKLKENTELTKNGQFVAAQAVNQAAAKAVETTKAVATVAVNQANAVNETIGELKTAVNGRMDDLLREAKAAAYAEGLAAGRSEFGEVRELVQQLKLLAPEKPR